MHGSDPQGIRNCDVNSLESPLGENLSSAHMVADAIDSLVHSLAILSSSYLIL